MEASQHSLLAACFTLHSTNATLAIVPQRGAGLWILGKLKKSKDIFGNRTRDLLAFSIVPQLTTQLRAVAEYRMLVKFLPI
jgi:hypothetical protein